MTVFSRVAERDKTHPIAESVRMNIGIVLNMDVLRKCIILFAVCAYLTPACGQFNMSDPIPDFNLTDLAKNITPNLPLLSELNVELKLPIKELYSGENSTTSASATPSVATVSSTTPATDSSPSPVTPTVRLRQEVLAKNGSIVRLDDILPKCHMKRIGDCMMPMLYFTHRSNTTGIAPTAKEFSLQCRAVLKFLECTDQYVKECATLMMREVYQLVKKSLLSSMSRICSNTPMRSNYIKHSPCIHAKVKLNPKYKATCVNDLQAALEYMVEFEEVDEWFNTFCCGYNKWEDCITFMTMDYCSKGNGSDRAVRDLIRSGTADFVYAICPRNRYNPESTFCEKSLPAKGTKAKGRHSKSAASKYFTLFCPNTGF